MTVEELANVLNGAANALAFASHFPGLSRLKGVAAKLLEAASNQTFLANVVAVVNDSIQIPSIIDYVISHFSTQQPAALSQAIRDSASGDKVQGC